MNAESKKPARAADEPEPEVVIAETVEEPLPPFEETEHPLLDVDYDGAPATAGLDYPEPGEVEDENEVAEPKGAKKS